MSGPVVLLMLVRRYWVVDAAIFAEISRLEDLEYFMARVEIQWKPNGGVN
jgi:uncharacterized protein YutE (UPF0331/DUF86 family)